MKAEILKIAKCKTEKQFYSKYPSEEAFMKAHGKEFKKAQMGVAMSKPATPSYSDLLNQTQLNVTGTNNKIQQEQAYKQQMLTAQQQPKQSGGFDFGKAIGQFGDIAGKIGASKMGKSYNGKRIPKAQIGDAIGKNQSSFNPLTGQWEKSSLTQGLRTPSQNSVQGMPSSLGYNLSGNTNSQQFDLSGNAIQGQSLQQTTSGMPNAQVESSKGSDILGKISKQVGKFAKPAGDIIGGIQAFGNEQDQLKSSQQTLALGNLSREAQDSGFQASARDAASMRSKQFLRPEEQVFTGENLFPVGGVGTNPLAKDGISLDNRIGGNPGEIQNTFAPNDIYTDSGYEPLSDSEIVKQYREGGLIPKAINGFTDFMGAGGTDTANNLVGGAFDNNAGYQMGKGVGSALKMIPGVGPVVGAIAAPVLGAIGGTLDNAFGPAGKIKKANAASDLNMNQMAMGRGMQGFAGQNSGFMEDGGWMNPEYNPQVITKFGEHNMSDLLAPDKSMDTLRAGGHLQSYTPPNEEAMQTYKDGGDVSTSALDGEIQTTWGGGVKTLSRNRYMPGTGETVQFVGNSHETHDGNGHTGIGVKYGQGNQDSYTNYAEYGTEQADASVEVEKEPAAELIDPKTGKKILTIWGNLPIPKYGADMIGDPDAKGKFKGYVANLSDKETKANKTISKATNKLLEFTPKTAFDKLKFSALQASIDGSNMQLKEIAEWKENAANLQNAINEHAEENGWVADDLAKGKIKIDSNPNNAKFGGMIYKAKDGYTPSTDGKVGRENYDYLVGLYNEAKKQGKGPAVEKFQREFSRLAPQKAQSVLSQFPVTNYGKAKGITTPSLESNYDQIFGDRTKAYRHSLEAPPAETLLQPRGTGLLPIPAPPSNALMPMTPREIPTTEKEQSPWLTAFNSIVPYFRPTDKIARPDLSSEMMAMGMNQLEPVQAQLYHPQLDVPYDVSFQDQLNEINAQTRGAQRMAGYDPATQAAIAAQAYGPQSRVLAEQFRANQAMKDKVYSGNRATLNDAQLKNLAILDQQATKQAQAKSNTKEQALEIAKSISDKINKHKMEQTLANLEGQRYNYRFDPRTGRPINVNAPQEFNIPTVGTQQTTGTIPGTFTTATGQTMYPQYKNDGSVSYVSREKAITDEPVPPAVKAKATKKRNGAIVQSLKRI